MKAILIALLSLGVSSTGLGIVIDNPLSLQTPFLVGILNGQRSNSNLTTVLGYAQTILDLSLGQKTGTAGAAGVFEANTVFNFAGTITGNDGQDQEPGGGFGDANDSVSIPAGWRWVLAKYDGQNAGYVLFALGNQASTIPESPWNLWTDGQPAYGISHYVLLDGPAPPPGDDPPDDDPPNVPEGGVGVGLFGLLLAGMGAMRARLARRKA